MTKHKELTELLLAAGDQGWTVEKASSGHHRLIPPEGGPGTCISSTPSDYRTVKNEIAKLKRMGLHSTKACLASWHLEDDTPARFCPRCKRTWKIPKAVPEPEPTEEFVVPEEWMEPKEPQIPPVKEPSEDKRSIRAHVLDALSALSEPVSAADVAELTGIPRKQVSTALRSLLGKHRVERDQPGMYFIPHTEVPKSDSLGEEQAEEPLDILGEKPPPEPTQERLVATPISPKALFESTGIRDQLGRDVIQSETGELFVAIPLVLAS